MIHKKREKTNKHFKIVKIKKNLVPICQYDDQILCYNRGKIMLLDIDSLKIKKTVDVPVGKMRRILGLSSLFSRRFGLNAVRGALIDRSTALLNYRRRLYTYDFRNNYLKLIPMGEMAGANGSALHLSTTSHGCMWGDYGYNPEKKAMGIYLYNAKKEKIEQVWEFDKGEVNHIHNIVEDSNSGRIWVFTGDFNDSAAIYYTDDFFENLQCAIKGKQYNRACIGFSVDNILYYASDSSNEDCNGIYKLENRSIIKLHDINGSVIYGYCDNGKMIISTTVENQSSEYNNYSNKYKYNLGNGIKDWYVEVSIFDYKLNKMQLVVREKKDMLPMIPYLYGCFRFPANGRCDSIFMFGEAVRKYDQWLVKCQVCEKSTDEACFEGDKNER